MRTPIEFAHAYSPSACKWHRDENMALARVARPRPDSIFFKTDSKTVADAVARARFWNREMLAGGSDAYRYRVARGLPVSGAA